MSIVKNRLFLLLALWLLLVNALVLFTGWSGLKLLFVGSFVLFVPGWLLLTCLRKGVGGGWTFNLYCFGLSLAYLIGGGLLLNYLLPLLRIPQPLGSLPVLFFVNLSIIMLGFFAYRRIEITDDIRLPKLDATSLAVVAASVMVVALSCLGTTLLNNNGSNYLIIITIASIIGLVAAVLVLRKRLPSWMYPISIYCIGLSLLLFYSLRSWHILGWDINLEYQVFQLTLQQQQWSMANLPGAEYNACLSITILPTLLHSLLGVQPEYIFKFVIQALFAVVPVAMFCIGRQYFAASVAFVGAVIYASQAWFIEQMPALIRQEIAFVFMAIALLALFDKQLSAGARRLLFAVCSLGIVVSHYSTTYIWIALLVAALVLTFILKRLVASLRQYKLRLDWRIVVATIVCAFLWNAQLTGTAGSTASFLQGSFNRMADIFTAEALSGAVAKIGFSNPTNNTAVAVQDEYQRVRALYQAGGEEGLYAGYETYQPTVVDDAYNARQVLPDAISTPLAILSKLVKLLLINVLPVIGSGYLLWQLAKGRFKDLEYASLCIGSLTLIALMTFLPFVQANYNLTRLFMQLSIILSLPVAVILFRLLRVPVNPNPGTSRRYLQQVLRSGRKHWWSFSIRNRMNAFVRRLRSVRHLTIIVVLAVFLCSGIGLTDQLTGGPMRITLNQPGHRYDIFYFSDAELAAAHWLAAHRDPLLPVYADVVTGLHLNGFADIRTTNPDIFPATIYRDSYVYLGYSNVARDVFYRSFRNDIMSYGGIKAFLQTTKDKIYSSGSSEIYR